MYDYFPVTSEVNRNIVQRNSIISFKVQQKTKAPSSAPAMENGVDSHCADGAHSPEDGVEVDGRMDGDAALTSLGSLG